MNAIENAKDLMKIGDLKCFNDGDGAGWYVAKLCPMDTSHPDPKNAFWQQVSKNYAYSRCALKKMIKMMNA